MSSSATRWVRAAVAIAAFACCAPLRAEEQKPVDIGLAEKTGVRMVVVDVVVLDRSGNPVSGLTADDFEIHAGGKEVPVATLDTVCPGGVVAEPSQQSGLAEPSKPSGSAPPARAPVVPARRRFAIVLDYQHLQQLQRAEVLDKARAMVRDNLGEGDEVMVAALTGGLRIEQPFSTDSERTQRTLRRMEYDITLWNGNFRHMSEEGFVRGLSGLFDVLGTVPGPKAVVLYSAMGDVPLEHQFDKIAAMAAGARCSIYPVDVRGLASQSATDGVALAGAG